MTETLFTPTKTLCLTCGKSRYERIGRLLVCECGGYIVLPGDEVLLNSRAQKFMLSHPSKTRGKWMPSKANCKRCGKKWKSVFVPKEEKRDALDIMRWVEVIDDK